MPSPAGGKIPTMCSCGKYPWSEVAVLVQGKRSPDQKGNVKPNTVINPSVPLVASRSCDCTDTCKGTCKISQNLDERKGIKKKKKKKVDLSDCGVEPCETEEFKMMTDPFSDNNIDQDDIEGSADFLEIDG